MPDAGIHPIYTPTCELCEFTIGTSQRMKPWRGGWAHTECIQSRHE